MGRKKADIPNPHKELGSRVRYARVCMGLSRKEFAEVLDKSAATVSNWEHGYFPCPDYLRAKIADLSGLNPAWVVDGTGDPHVPEKVAFEATAKKADHAE